MDDLIKHFILHNKLLLTLLAMAFTPVGLWTVWRYMNRDGARPDNSTLGESETATRLAAVERTLGALVAEVAKLRRQQERLTAAPEREQLPASRPASPQRVITPH